MERESRTDGGTYTLLVELHATTTLEVGALGVHEFDRGWYAYTGSALGTGGFARVDSGATRIADVTTTADVDAECAIHREIASAGGVAVPVAGFGASDCDCSAHLAYAGQRATLAHAVEAAHDGRR
ncbi:DUF123 domain-containing protein [Halobacteriales archaeon QS_1_68_20]|nr:MAG: DUF123 domain-containing protein [Halobacteriales archaeon QS_1_68_20]